MNESERIALALGLNTPGSVAPNLIFLFPERLEKRPLGPPIGITGFSVWFFTSLVFF